MTSTQNKQPGWLAFLGDTAVQVALGTYIFVLVLRMASTAISSDWFGVETHATREVYRLGSDLAFIGIAMFISILVIQPQQGEAKPITLKLRGHTIPVAVPTLIAFFSVLYIVTYCFTLPLTTFPVSYDLSNDYTAFFQYLMSLIVGGGTLLLAARLKRKSPSSP